LQFDVDSRVRIVAFVNPEAPYGSPQAISEQWVDADVFYAIVSGWQTLFSMERTGRLKAKASLR
jgi:hypothetical protein